VIGTPAWPRNPLWLLAGLTWLVTLIGYVGTTVARGRVWAELTDPTFAPFVSLVPIVPMLLGVAVGTSFPRPAPAPPTRETNVSRS
jgi:tryptophan-rich sensory protein